MLESFATHLTHMSCEDWEFDCPGGSKSSLDKLAISMFLSRYHYVNTPIQYSVNFNICKNDNFQMQKKKKIFFLFFAL